MSAESHKKNADHDRKPVRVAVLTVSDTRTPQDDESGRRVREIVEHHQHRVVAHRIVPDDPEAIRAEIEGWTADSNIDVILVTGGTGIARRDNTIDTVRRLLTSELDGFGELFRMLSWHEVGSAAMLTRAVGGLVARGIEVGGDTFLFAMPGSVNAVETAMTKLIGPELGHLVWERRK